MPVTRRAGHRDRSTEGVTGGRTTGVGSVFPVGVVRAVGGSTYLCGGGSGDYLDTAAFERASLTLRFQEYRHPVYEQRGVRDFVPGLSIIDALMHCGFDGVRNLMAMGR